MERRNTIQKELVLNAVKQLHRHVTADEVYDHVKQEHASIGRGTVYRNLGILADENKIRRIEISDGSDRYDFRLDRHYHVECVRCGSVFDVDMDDMGDISNNIHDRQGMIFLDYDILFKGICPECQKIEEKEKDRL